MPRDRRAVIGTKIWDEESIRALTFEQQHAYQLVYTQGDLNRCGVIAYRPKRWQQLAVNLTVAHLNRQFRALHDSRHVVLDLEYEELLVRTYVGHDGLLAQPLVVSAMIHDFGEVASPLIRLEILRELRRLWAKPKLPLAERKGLLLLLGVDPATLEIAHDKPGMLARIRMAIGDGLADETFAALKDSRLDPYVNPPADPRTDPLVDLLPDGCTRTPSPTPTPPPLPTPPPAPDAHPTDHPPKDDPTSALLIEHIRAYTQKPPVKAITDNRLAIQQLIAEGIHPDRIRAGLTRMRERSLGPALLPQLVAETTPTTDRPNSTRRSTTDDAVAQAQAVASRYANDPTAREITA